IHLPAPCISNVESAADLACAPMRHVIETSWVAAIATATLGEVMHDATCCAFALVGGFGAVLPQLRNDGTQRANQFECSCVCDQHLHQTPWLFSEGTP